MSVRLACSLSDRIAAIGLVAGAYYPPDALDKNAGEDCPGTVPMPVIAFHGVSDWAVPFDGGSGVVGDVTFTFRLPIDNGTAIEDVMADWSAHNRCTGGRQESQFDTEVRLIEYESCGNNATVQLYAVDGGGHTWPGAPDLPWLGYTTHQVNATDLMESFFTAHTLVQPASVGGVAQQPVLPASPAGHGRLSYGTSVIALAVVGAFGAAGWYVRRNRAA